MLRRGAVCTVVWADPIFATQLRDAAFAGDEAMKTEEEAIYARYAAERPDLTNVAKKVVFLEERQPAIDKFAAGVSAMLHTQKDITGSVTNLSWWFHWPPPHWGGGQ